MEILAALLVIAVGIIGVAALYSDTVHIDEEVQLHTRAEQLAAEMAELIDTTAEGREGYAGTVGVICNAKRTLKLPQDVAANAAACWQDRVEKALPSGLGTITRDTSTTPVRYVVAVSWSAPERGAASYVIQVAGKG